MDVHRAALVRVPIMDTGARASNAFVVGRSVPFSTGARSAQLLNFPRALPIGEVNDT
jgi:hypothetical protein